ncbi:hypothetical protein [Streptomyces sp. TR02-1]|uniref:hypothetical protein n=1 Tax=Streptomyces sp. TR02-1 TaxID=3385977 RepID=UPI0039A10C0F
MDGDERYTRARRHSESGDKLPYRVVDAHDQGWHVTVMPNREEAVYSADYGWKRGLGPMTRDELEAERGPLRPVVPPDGEECERITAALTSAGNRAAASVLVSLYRIACLHADEEAERSGCRVSGRLYAGREGSWESAAVRSLAWGLGAKLSERPKRYDAQSVGTLVAVLDGWTSSPGRFVEVAANLSDLFSEVADRSGGWPAVSDRYLQVGSAVGHPLDVVESVRGYLLATSRVEHGW